MTPFAIVGTVYLILLAICFAVSAVSLAVIATRMGKTGKPTPEEILFSRPDWVWTNSIPVTSWPTKNGKSVEHGEG